VERATHHTTHCTFCECCTLHSLQLFHLSHIFIGFSSCTSEFVELCVLFCSEQLANLLSNGRRFLCTEVHRDCSSWCQCWTVWRLKASSSEGSHCYLACCLSDCEIWCGSRLRRIRHCSKTAKIKFYKICAWNIGSIAINPIRW